MAITEAVEEIAEIFRQMDDEYMRERAADVQDIGKRFLLKCKNAELQDLSAIFEPVIVIARDLYPSDTVKMNPEIVKGIITQEGGVTSHVSIMAKNYGIPALTGVAGILDEVEAGDEICMDAQTGEIYVKPEPEIRETYGTKQREQEEELEKIKSYRQTDPVTADGKRIYLCVNVGNTEEIKQALDKNIDGVGLFRTEFLSYGRKSFPHRGGAV